MLSWTTPRRRIGVHDACLAVTGLAIALLASLASVGCDPPPPPAPIFVPPMPAPAQLPPPASALCLTEGDAVPSGGRVAIREPATRGYLAGSTGDAASLAFTYRGPSRSVAALASGNTRAQLGLKLRAEDSCNVIYVMWRLEPVTEIVVQVKRNEAHEHRACGAEGYVTVRPRQRALPPPIGVPERYTDVLDHELRAAIVDDTLEVFADRRLVWRGTLPARARDLRGPAGFRTDNVEVDLSLAAPIAAGDGARSSCPPRLVKRGT